MCIGVIFINDIRASKPLRQLHAHVDEVSSLKLTNDGRLISVGKDHSFKVFNLSGQELFQIILSEAYWYNYHYYIFVFFPKFY